MEVEELGLGVKLLRPRQFRDDRGWFSELWNASRYESAGVPPFVQDNVSVSRRNVLRGLHYQHPHGQGKLVTVMAGTVFDVAVDIRTGSPTFGHWVGRELDAGTFEQLYIPEGFAHGFVVLSESAVFHYKCTKPYVPEAEGGILWRDPAIGIDWPCADPVLSDRDAAAPALAAAPSGRLPMYNQEPGSK
jgi:dTDP-4-dehydrorhamnose 3,5-epimerase